MPDTRAHRGPHPADQELFSEDALEAIRQGVGDYSWLLSRGYAGKSALKIVGDRYRLRQRQRMAVMRSACSDQSRAARHAKEVELSSVTDQRLAVDGYNVLTTIEAALAGGVILEGRDGSYRDLASIHGTFRKVSETEPALKLLAETALEAHAAEWVWFLDRPVSNSGRLKTLISQIARQHKCPWTVEVVFSPDAELIDSADVVCTSDSVILDRCQRWCNLTRFVIAREVPDAWRIRLSS